MAAGAAVIPLDASIVVTGAGGFIGGWLVGALRRRGHRRIRAVDVKPAQEWHQRIADTEQRVLDLREPAACAAALAGADHVFHLAADMGGMGFIASHRVDCMLSAVIDAHVLSAAARCGVARLLYTSSACVYRADRQDAPDLAPLAEDDAYPAMPEDGYGWQKLYTERLCRHFSEERGLATRVARLHNVYGPHGTWRGGREKAPAAICRKVAEAKLRGRCEIAIWGDGRQTRSFLFIDDALTGLIGIMASDCDTPLNLGSSELVSIDALVGIVEDIAGVRLARVYDRAAPQGVRGRNSDNTRLRQCLGWEPSTSLRAGLAQTYRWIEEQVAAAGD